MARARNSTGGDDFENALQGDQKDSSDFEIFSFFCCSPSRQGSVSAVHGTIEPRAGRIDSQSLCRMAPFRIDLESISVGWFQPLQVRGLRLIDQSGLELVKVAELDTELGLVQLARNYQSLGTITIRGAQMQVDVQPGTTSVEEALKPLLGSPSSSPTPSTSSTAAIYPPVVFVLKMLPSWRGIRWIYRLGN